MVPAETPNNPTGYYTADKIGVVGKSYDDRRAEYLRATRPEPQQKKQERK